MNTSGLRKANLMNKNFIIAALSIVILSGFTSSVPMEYEYYMIGLVDYAGGDNWGKQ